MPYTYDAWKSFVLMVWLTSEIEGKPEVGELTPRQACKYFVMTSYNLSPTRPDFMYQLRGVQANPISSSCWFVTTGFS